jgi:hypothetical protein
LDLCLLSDVKGWLNVPAATVAEDALFSRLVTAVSADFLAAIARPDLAPEVTYTEVRAGNGKCYLYTRHWPINSVTSVTVDGQTIPASTDGVVAGWWLEANLDPENRVKITLAGSGYKFSKNSSIVIVYKAGYANVLVTNEQANIPASPYAITVAKATDFIADSGITFVIGGGALTKVAVNPAASQYAVSSLGVYTFAAADTGKGVYISYQTLGVPADIRQAVIEWVSYRYKSRQWIGQTSKSLQPGGEHISFQSVPMPETTRAVIEQYRTTGLMISHD